MYAERGADDHASTPQRRHRGARMLAHLEARCEIRAGIASRLGSVETRGVDRPSRGRKHPGASPRRAHRMTNDNSMTRRQFVAQTAAAVALSGSGAPGQAHAAPLKETLLALTATQAARALRRGEISAESYASALLAQCKRGASLNAFITLRPDRVLEAARACDRKRSAGAKLGPLHGLPIPIKDSVNTKDLPTTAGTPALRNFQPSEDAPLVRALREAGAIVLGKTNLHELSYGYTSNNHAFGAIHNPYDTTRIPGGSSGGTAAAIAYHMAPLGVAEDTEGSIRGPAALCGLPGLRPTTRRAPAHPCAPTSPPPAQSTPDLRKMIEPAVTPGSHDFVPDSQYDEIVKVHLPALRTLYRDYFARSGVAATVFPATMLPAPTIGEENMEVEVRGRRMPLDEAMARNIAPGSTAGLPGLVLPAGLTASGLPVALEFDGPSGADRKILELGLALEAALGKLPPPPGALNPTAT